MVLTKADTLDYLKNRIAKSRIEDLMIVTGKIFEENRKQILADIQSQFKGQTIVVRSSCSNEDSSRHQMRVIMTVYWMSTLMIAMLYVMRLRQYLILIKKICQISGMNRC